MIKLKSLLNEKTLKLLKKKGCCYKTILVNPKTSTNDNGWIEIDLSDITDHEWEEIKLSENDDWKDDDDIEVPDSYKPTTPTTAKAKIPRTQVCARFPRWRGEYDRYDWSDIVYSKQNYMYEGIANLISQGHTIVYGNMEEEKTLRQIAFVMSAIPE